MAAVAAPPKAASNGSQPIQVPWTQRQEEAIKALVESGDKTPWRLGDAALEAVPMGEVGVRTGGQKFIRLLAARTGTEFDRLRASRDVAHAWPPPTRVGAASYDAHRAYVSGGPAEARERASLLKRLVKEAPHGKVTAEAVRKERAKEMGASYRSRTAEDHLLSLCDHVRKLAGSFRTEVPRHLLEAELNEKWCVKNSEQVYERANQLFYAGSLLQKLVDGEELPSKEEIREQLDPKAW